MNTTESSLGDRVSDLRQKKGITKKQLAEQIGISPTYLSRIENNESDPSSSVLAKIALFFNESMEYFLFGEIKDIEWPEERVDRELRERTSSGPTKEGSKLGPSRGLDVLDYDSKKQILKLFIVLERQQQLKEDRAHAFENNGH